MKRFRISTRKGSLSPNVDIYASNVKWITQWEGPPFPGAQEHRIGEVSEEQYALTKERLEEYYEFIELLSKD
jgi:hypothetical protein